MGIPNKSNIYIYVYIHVFAYLSPRVIHHSWPLISKLVKLSFGQGYLSFSPVNQWESSASPGLFWAPCASGAEAEASFMGCPHEGG